MQNMIITTLCALATTAVAASPVCTLLTIPVAVTNIVQKNFRAVIDHSTFDGTYGSLPNHTVTGTYNISASYCTPTTYPTGKSSTLQILIHGGDYNKTYWSGLKTAPASINTTYSYVDYATSQGYNVLAIDRLCNGASSHPDGANVCQVQTEAAAIHAVVQKARAGTLIPGSSKAFSTIINVSHSFGSYISSYYTNTYPIDTNATILTGIALTLTPYYAFASASQPARDIFPRYANFADTYVTFADLRTFTGFFYYGNYDPKLPPLDFSGTGTIPIGEAVSILALAGPGITQPNVRTPLFIMNGQNDELECPKTVLDPVYGSGGDCGDGDSSLTALTKSQFPNVKAADFGYFNVPNTGHCINLHYSAPTAYAAAQKWLTSKGF